jgi:hypothetical protein
MITAALKWLTAAAAVTALAVLTSCGSNKPVKVVIDNADGDTSTVVIDGKTTVKLQGDTTMIVELKPGKHSLVVNNGKAQEFKVGRKGGLLNIDNVEYIAYEVEYSASKLSGSGLNFSGNTLKAMVVVDSFLIKEKGSMSPVSENLMQQKLDEIMKDPDGNIFPTKMGETDIHGLRKFGKDKLFIDRFWDYNMTEEMPERIQIRARKGDLNASSSRSQIVRAKLFLLMAMLNRDVYEVRSFESIRTGKKDEEMAMDDEEGEGGETAPPVPDKN